jgi:TolA-binding protein
LDDLKQVLILNPDHFDAMFGLGRMFEEMGDLRRASEVYIRVLDYHPNHTRAKEGQTRLRKSGIGRTL